MVTYLVFTSDDSDIITFSTEYLSFDVPIFVIRYPALFFTIKRLSLLLQEFSSGRGEVLKVWVIVPALSQIHDAGLLGEWSGGVIRGRRSSRGFQGVIRGFQKPWGECRGELAVIRSGKKKTECQNHDLTNHSCTI